MSRNIRRKAAPAPQRNKRRRVSSSSSSSSLDLESDGGYSALEDLSDSEDDDEDGVNAAEEEHIITAVTSKSVHSQRSPRSSDQDEDEDADEEVVEEEDSNDENENENGSDDEDLEEILARVEGEEDDNDGETASWNGIVSESDAVTAAAGQHEPTRRQVRFTGVPDSDSDSDDSTLSEMSEVNAEYFPDIFVEQASLDPGFRHKIEDESDSSVSSSFWDYAAASNPLMTEAYVGDIADMGNFGLLPGDHVDISAPATPAPETSHIENAVEPDGYESDTSSGDTTEDDEPKPTPIKQLITTGGLFDDQNSDTEVETQVHTPVRRRGQPSVSRFILQRTSRPVAFMHPVTKKILILTPQKPRDDLDELLSAASLPDFNLFSSEMDTIQSSPLTNNAVSIMVGMGSMLSSHTFGDIMSHHNTGPAEVFCPPTRPDILGAEDSDLSSQLFEDDEEANLRIEDFIDLGLDGGETVSQDILDLMMVCDEPYAQLDDNGVGQFPSGDNADGDDDTTTPGTGTPTATTQASGFPAVEVDEIGDDDEDDEEGGASLHPLLEHFDKNADTVGAFRRNQIDQQLIYSNKATPESLAFSAPYLMSTIRGVKNGSLDAVTTPITPPRRHKSHTGNGLRHDHAPIPSSPLAVSAQKRKASDSVDDAAKEHKRYRSISEVKNLAL